MARMANVKGIVSIKIGQFIKEKREELGLTQAGLGNKVGYKWGNFIGAIENGKGELPMDKIWDYAEALFVPKQEFLKLVISEIHPEWLPFLSFHDPRDMIKKGKIESSEDEGEDCDFGKRVSQYGR